LRLSWKIAQTRRQKFAKKCLKKTVLTYFSLNKTKNIIEIKGPDWSFNFSIETGGRSWKIIGKSNLENCAKSA